MARRREPGQVRKEAALSGPTSGIGGSRVGVDRPDRTGKSFGTYDRELARSMALCTRHFRVDRAVGVYNDDTGRVDLIKGLGVLKKFFLAEKKSWQSQLKVPALLFFGEHELSVNPYKVAEKAKKTIPHIEAHVLKHAGHGAIFDQPEKVANIMREFVFERVLARRGRHDLGEVGEHAS